MGFVLFILSFLFVFGIIVFVHEFGHFIAAKTSGVKVLEFGFGFPPAIFKKKKGETVYSINAIPFGGFVKMLGEGGEEKNNPRSFVSRPKWIKAKIISAGVIMNLVLAWFILSLLYVIGFSPLIPGMENHTGVANHIYIENIEKDSSAAKVGIQKNDEILSIDSKKIVHIEDIRGEIKDKAGQVVKVEIRREGDVKTLTVTPYKETIEGQEITRIGITTFEALKADNIFIAPIAGFTEAGRMVVLTVVGLGEFFGRLFFSFNVSENAVGPVGIAVLTNEVRQLGFTYLLQFLAIISLSLALLNIMPIPALDGGHLLLIFVEKIRGRDVSQVLKNTLTIIGFVFLISLMLVITSRDIMRFGIFDSIKNFIGIK